VHKIPHQIDIKNLSWHFDPLIAHHQKTINISGEEWNITTKEVWTNVTVTTHNQTNHTCEVWHGHHCLVWVAPPALNDTEREYLKKFDIFTKISHTIKIDEEACNVSLSGLKYIESYAPMAYQRELERCDLDNMATLFKVSF